MATRASEINTETYRRYKSQVPQPEKPGQYHLHRSGAPVDREGTLTQLRNLGQNNE